MKSNKGITLVALVITIIVLLILAGVSISLVVGDNGVLTQASNASEKTDIAKAKEAVEQGVSSLQGTFVDSWSANTAQTFINNGITETDLRNAINSAYPLTLGNVLGSGATASRIGSIKVNGE